MNQLLDSVENFLTGFFGNIKIVEKGLLGLQGSYVELLTILSLGLLAVIPVIVSSERRQFFRHLNQIFGIMIFIFVVFTCLGVFGMIRNFHRGLNEIGRENIVALYYLSVPLTILATSMIFGATFCGWICPTGSIQEFISIFTRKWWMERKKKNFPFSWWMLFSATAVFAIFILWMWRLSVTRSFFIEDSNIYWSEVLIILLFALVWRQKQWDGKLRKLKVLSFWIIVAGALMSIRITSPVHLGFAKVYDPASFLATAMVVFAALVVPRVWCRYLCPWKIAIAWAAKHSSRKLEFDPDKCIHCAKCTYVCEIEAVEEGKIDPKECLMCFKCADICPTGAIRLSEKWCADCSKGGKAATAVKAQSSNIVDIKLKADN